jgi:hypothetical protein
LTNIRENCEYYGPMHYLFTDFKKAFASVRREIMYKIEFGTPKKLTR